MSAGGGYPGREKAEELLNWAGTLNPGPWIRHCQTAARAAETIARAAGMEPDKAYALGLLHDIGRYEGVRAMHHVIAGYRLMMDRGYGAAARVCMTHSFPVQDIDMFSGKQDCTEEERAFIEDFLARARYDDYDRLIQLCDAISLPSGVALMEVRLMDVAMRHGTGPRTPEKWRAFLDLKACFDRACGGNVYGLFRREIVEGLFQDQG